MAGSHHDCDLARQLEDLGDRPPDAGWRFRAAMVPVAELFDDATDGLVAHVPVLIDPLEDGAYYDEPVETSEEAAHDIAHMLIDLAADDDLRPGRVDVDTVELATALRSLLEPTGIFVAHVPPESEDDAIARLRSELERIIEWMAQEAPARLVADIPTLRAAVALCDAAPWRFVTRYDPIVFETELPQMRWRCAVVHDFTDGALVWIIPSAQELWESIRTGDPAEHPDGMWTVEFHLPGQVSLARRLAAQRWGFPRTADGRLPVVAWMNAADPEADSDEEFPRPPDDISAPVGLALALAALADIDDAKVDSGRWTTEVSGPDGPMAVTMSWSDAELPQPVLDVLDDEDAWTRSTRARMALLDRLVARGQVPSGEERGRVLRLAPTAVIAELESTARTSLEHAEAMWFKAVHSHGRMRRRWADRAIELSPDCIGAWLVRADDATSVDERVKFLREAVAAGERVVTDDSRLGQPPTTAAALAFEAEMSLAETLRDRGDDEAAVQVLRASLDHRPGEPAACAQLASLLLRRGDFAEALSAIRESQESENPYLHWVRAIVGYMALGDTSWVRAAVMSAVRASPIVARALTEPEDLEDPEFGGPELERHVALARIINGELRSVVMKRPSFLEIVRDAMDEVARQIEAPQAKSGRRFKLRKPGRR